MLGDGIAEIEVMASRQATIIFFMLLPTLC